MPPAVEEPSNSEIYRIQNQMRIEVNDRGVRMESDIKGISNLLKETTSTLLATRDYVLKHQSDIYGEQGKDGLLRKTEQTYDLVRSARIIIWVIGALTVFVPATMTYWLNFHANKIFDEKFEQRLSDALSKYEQP